jgi:putative transposase
LRECPGECSEALRQPGDLQHRSGITQYTGNAFTGLLKSHEIRISMDGKGRALDNIMVERLWRSVKCEEVYTKEYESVKELRESLKQYFDFYNHRRPHQSFEEKTPGEIYREGHDHAICDNAPEDGGVEYDKISTIVLPPMQGITASINKEILS